MQSLNWYTKRLSTMSAEEILWRAKSEIRDIIDWCRVAFHQYPSIFPATQTASIETGYGFRLDLPAAGALPMLPEPALKALAHQAERIGAHRLSFFDLEDAFLGDPIDWNRDHGHGIRAPLTYAPAIDYRDFRVTGDCKLVWEPNRHHHLVVLGRAYRSTGERRFAAEAVAQLRSWMDQCPFGRGMNWRSPLELGIRLINWVWTVELIRESGLVSGEFRDRLLHSVYLHLWEITRKYARGSSANNHLIGEAAGVFVASSYFPMLPNAGKWRDESSDLLCREIFAQSYADGCTREQAFGYHLFVLQFFLIAGLVGRWTGRDFPLAYWQRLEKMFAFAAAILEGGEPAPMFGDADDGYVLDLGGRSVGFRGWLGAAALVFHRSDFKALCPEYSEPALWLLGQESRQAFDSLPSPSASVVGSRAFPDSGYYLLQCGADAGGAPAMSVLVDCGELGYGRIAAHGHADALSFSLRTNGRDVIVDPGTYDYFTFPEWRAYFRSTRAHNTVVVDGADQSLMAGSFMWGERAIARCLSWNPSPGGGRIVAEHDGYRRLRDPVVHRRSLDLDGQAGRLTIRDDLEAVGSHSVALVFHCSEECSVRKEQSHTLIIERPEVTLVMRLDDRLEVTIQTGRENPIAGWISRGYHRKVPAPSIIAEGRIHGSSRIITTVQARARSSALQG
jgi:hypothetical protein